MAFIFEVKVAPKSGRSEWLLDKSGRLKCYLKSPAEKGLANKELIQNLAKALNVDRAAIEIVSGETARIKLIKIPLTITLEQLFARLGIERQGLLFD
jgi:uncharacterized protein (TIGR00251 family)